MGMVRMRTLTFEWTVPDEVLSLFSLIGEHLKYKNRFSLPESLENLVSEFIDYHKDNAISLDINDRFWRARIQQFRQKEAFHAMDMGAPPQGTSSSGRINPQGISYLYGAFSIETAISEIRPWKGAEITVGEFEINNKLEVIDLENISKTGSFAKDISDIERSLKSQTTSKIVNNLYFSTPVHNHDELAYLPSQYISERFKSAGFHALLYPSVLHEEGKNIALFNPNLAECISATKYKVTGVSYEYENKYSNT